MLLSGEAIFLSIFIVRSPCHDLARERATFNDRDQHHGSRVVRRGRFHTPLPPPPPTARQFRPCSEALLPGPPPTPPGMATSATYTSNLARRCPGTAVGKVGRGDATAVEQSNYSPVPCAMLRAVLKSVGFRCCETVPCGRMPPPSTTPKHPS